MIHEYAIDPELVVAWGKDPKDSRYFYGEFGLGTPHFMADFPSFKKWRKQFRQAWATAGDTEKKRIETLYMRITEKRVCRLGPDYDDNQTWLENAEKENGRQAFQAILSTGNPRKHDRVLPASIFDDSPGNHPLWYVAQQSSSPRMASEMAELVAPLLINCTELHFVDPHFSPDNARHRKPLADFLKKATLFRERRPPIKRIVMHSSYTQEKPTPAFFRQGCEQKLPGIIPKGLQLELNRWQQRDGGEKLHNRYILTDIGGIKADPGLDEGQDGESFEAILLDRSLYEKHWNDYVLNPAFDPASTPVVIIGTACPNR